MTRYQNPIVKKQRDELYAEYAKKLAEFEATEFFSHYDMVKAMEPISWLQDQWEALDRILSK